MIVEEIPAGEQLMDASAIGSVSANQRPFLDGLEWPAAGLLNAQVAKTHGDEELLTDSVDWIQQTLRPAWIAPDLRERLRAARAIISNKDAFLTRYSLGGSRLQIIVTKYHVHLVIDPPRDGRAARVLAMLHEYLAVDRPYDKVPWSGEPWTVGQIGSLTFGYQPRSNISDWRDGVTYVTNGRAVKFSFEKVAALPAGSGPSKTVTVPSDEAERHWFDGKP